MRRSRISLPTNVQCATFVLGSGEGGHRPQSSSASLHLAGAAAWRGSGGGVTTRSTGPTTETSRRGGSRSGCARLGLQKEGLPIRCGSSYYRFKAIDAHEGQLGCYPLTLPGAENIARNAWQKLPLLSQHCGQFAERPVNKKV